MFGGFTGRLHYYLREGNRRNGVQCRYVHETRRHTRFFSMFLVWFLTTSKPEKPFRLSNYLLQQPPRPRRPPATITTTPCSLFTTTRIIPFASASLSLVSRPAPCVRPLRASLRKSQVGPIPPCYIRCFVILTTFFRAHPTPR